MAIDEKTVETSKSKKTIDETIFAEIVSSGYTIETSSNYLKYSKIIKLREPNLLPPGATHYKVKGLEKTGTSGMVALECINGTTQPNGFEKLPEGKKTIIIYPVGTTNRSKRPYSVRFG